MTDRWCLGLDLGQVTDYAALALVHERAPTPEEIAALPEARRRTPEPVHDIPYLHRWPLGTSYTRVIAATVARVRGVLAREIGARVWLIVDGTGVGRGVVDGLAEALTDVPAEMVAVIITSGTQPRFDLRPDGNQEWHVPKKDLIGAAQVLLQDGRLHVARGLAEAQTLTEELKNFRMKITASANAQYEAWREGDHDDLVLAVAMPCWALLHGPLGEPFAAAAGGTRKTVDIR
jgi:hypothetical protein